MKQKNNAFTIAELIVAMALLAILVALSSVVFSTSVKAHRKAAATIEVTRNLRVLTQQLTSDFDGLRADAPLFIGFNGVNTDGDPSNRPDVFYDQIYFFADGDFQTTKQYSNGTNMQTVTGNLARIYYGHANSSIGADDYTSPENCILSRRAHILTSNASLPIFPTYDSGADFVQFQTDFVQANNDFYEYDTLTLTEWMNILAFNNSTTPMINAEWVLENTMTTIGRPVVDFSIPETYHLLMTQGVLDFQIQWAYTPADLNGTIFGFTEGVRWWPSDDPDGDPDTVDSDYLYNPLVFGVYFNLGVDLLSNPNWISIEECHTGSPLIHFSDTFYPQALKFTFRLKDSNNRFSEGKTFTHIVRTNN